MDYKYACFCMVLSQVLIHFILIPNNSQIDKTLKSVFENGFNRHVLVPIFKPLGITDWRISTAFISGFMAKESVVSTLTILIGGDVSMLPAYFNKLTAFVFLVFSLLYTPCVAAIATVKRELGKTSAFLVVLLQCTIAWIVAFIVYQIGSLIL